ncbi:MAG: hypothetical protein HY080_08120 [Gammaproteobacteria bacterium]|nr:hypothetical protein [Gammaproteobacteria bacterium]
MLRAKAARLSIIPSIVLLFSCCDAQSATNFSGKWLDNASARIGDLSITKNSIDIAHVASYTVAEAGTFGPGEIYKVSNLSVKPDPLGCGPSGRVNYIVILPLADIPGTNQQGIRMIFYGGAAAPSITTLDDDPAVCAQHSFGKATSAR